MQNLVIIGAGGHAKVIIDIAEAANDYRVSYLVDAGKAGETVLGYPVRANLMEIDVNNFVIAIGDNKVRAREFKRMALLGWRAASLVHPQSTISKYSQVGRGTVIAAGTIVNPDTRIADNCIINTGSTVDHDCNIGSHVHIAPGCRLAGGVNVDDGAFLGIGTVVLPKCNIGAWSIIGAGSLVKDNVMMHDTVAGVPARIISFKPDGPEDNMSSRSATSDATKVKK